MEDSHWKYLNHMDSSGLREMMISYGEDIWNLAFLLTKRRDMADDISQDVFLRAYKSIGAFRGESSVRTWLLSITRNISINYLRTAFMRKVILTNSELRKGTSPSAEAEVMGRSFSDEIWETVLGLPVKLREVLILHAKYELDTKEIAGMLGIAEGTVKSRLARARRRMTLDWEGDTAYER